MNFSNTAVLEEVPCPLGCSVGDEFVLAGSDLLHALPGKFNVVKCRGCGLLRTNPRPAPESMGPYYPDSYGPYLGTQVRSAGLKSASALKELLKQLARHVFHFNTEPLPPIATGHLLEIGCASGAFMHGMASQGWRVQGIEFSAEAAGAASALGYQVHAGALETAPNPDEPFDLVVGWMVLEHLHDPLLGLKKLRQWAKADAYLVLSVPNAASLEFCFFKDRWYALQLPTHLYHFTPKSIGKVLDAGGWTIEKICHQRVLGNAIASTGYVLFDKGMKGLGQKLIDFPQNAGRWNYALYPLAWLLSLFGQTGRMTIWAKAKQ